MILQSRRWRLTIRTVTLLVTSLLMLAFAGPASYALQNDTPTTITAAAQLLDRTRPLDGTYITVEATPDLTRSFALPQIITAYHWIPLRGFNNEIIVRVEEKNYFFSYGYTPSTGFTGAEQVHYTGKLLALKNQVGADKIVQELAGHGIKVDKDTAMILSQGEIPSA